MKFRRLSNAAFLCVISSAALAQTFVTAPVAYPSAITTNTPIVVKVSSLITSIGQTVAPNGVTLVQVDANGGMPRVVAILHDDGQNGDAFAKDGIYSGLITLNSIIPAPLYFEVSVALTGVLRRSISLVSSIVVVAQGFPVAFAPPSISNLVSVSPTDKAVCNELLVSFSPTATPAVAAGIAAKYGGTLVGMLPALGVYQMNVPTCDATSLSLTRNALLSDSMIASVDYDRTLSITGVVSKPNDPYFGEGTQWYLEQINAPAGWALAQQAGVIHAAAIAVLDSGINADHEDLFGHVVPGINWCGALIAGNCAGISSDTQDDLGHGTSVAGLAGALSNNGVGVASPAFNTLIVAEKINAPKSGDSIPDIAVANAIYDAVNAGARVINISAASTGDSCSHALLNAIKYADSSNVLIVASAGNDGTSTRHCPAAFSVTNENVVAVGASDKNDGRASFSKSDGSSCNPKFPSSSYGSWVTVYAPGVEMFVLGPANTGTLAYVYDWPDPAEPNCSNGTSFAAPLVTGVAAMMWAVNPHLKTSQVKAILQNTAATRNGNLDSSGSDGNNLIKRIDMGAAVTQAAAESGVSDAPPMAGFVMSSGSQLAHNGQTLILTVTPRGSASVVFNGASPYSTDIDGTVTSWRWSIDGILSSSTSMFSRALTEGTYQISLIVGDDSGTFGFPAAIGTIVVQEATAPSYTLTDLGPVLPGYSFCRPGRINDAGTIIGVCYGGTNGLPFEQGFIWTTSTGITALPVFPGGSDVRPFDINRAGAVVGDANGFSSSLCCQGFLFSGGSLQALGVPPGATNSIATGINNLGQIVGDADKTASGVFRDGYLYDHGTFTYLGLAAGELFGGGPINDVGQVIGDITVSGVNHAAVWQSGKVTDLSTLPGGTSGSHAHAINASSQVVGYSYTGSGNYHGFLWSSGSGMSDLGTLAGDFASDASSTNDSGQAVGWSFGGTTYRAFFWQAGLGMTDLNSLVVNGAGWTLMGPVTYGPVINNSGQIAGLGTFNGQPHAYLLASGPQSSGAVMNDSFVGSTVDTSKWQVAIAPQGAGPVTETSQGVQMTQTLLGIVSYQGLQSRCFLNGDFDAQVDFKLLNWSGQNYHTVRFGAMDLPQGPFGMLGIYRNSYAGEDYQMRTDSGVVADVGSTATAGTMRLVRTGSTIYGYYSNGTGFNLLGSASTTKSETRFALDFSTPNTTAPAGISVSFQNFKVNLGNVGACH